MPLEIRQSADIISSRNNQLVVRIGKLEDKKHREDERLFCLEGVKLLCEALSFGVGIEYILVREDSYEHIMEIVNVFLGERAICSGGTLVRLSESAFGKLSSEKSPEGVITVAKYIDKFHKKGKIEKGDGEGNGKRMLMLESVRDPGNLGTLLRSAAAFGIEKVIMSDDCADIYNTKTIRAAMGAVFKVETLRVESIPETAEALKECGRRVFATALDKDALKLGDFQLKASDVFLIGNEGHGLSENAIKSASSSVFIPMAEGTESLNAAIAASVCMWEISKL